MAKKLPSASTFEFVGLDKEPYQITMKEKLFVEMYLKYRGNGVDAIFEAGYKPKNRMVAAAMASENLTKPHIIAYVQLKLEEYGLNDEGVEREHLYLVNQYGDLPAKARAIDMYYKKKGLYQPTKYEFVDENDDLTDEEIAEELARRTKSGKPAGKSKGKKKG